MKSVMTHFLMTMIGITTPVPDECPSIKAIQEVPILVSKKGDEYYTKQLAKFGTLEKWGFIVYHLSLNDPEAVLKAATAAVKTLHGSPKPAFQQQKLWGNRWYCQYQNDYGYETFAWTVRTKSV